jgi:fructose-bisphosphate aldolase class II
VLVNPIELYKKAQKGGYAVGAFNTSTLEITRAIIQAAEEQNSPVIIETSEGEVSYLSPEISGSQAVALAKKAKVPVALHLDHGKSMKTVKEVIKNGYTSIHLDGSLYEFAENIKNTKEAVKFAHQKGICVEGEIGHISGGSELHDTAIKISADSLTDPKEAKEFVLKTGVDVLAVAIGNIHGMYTNPPKLDFERLGSIKKAAKCFFSLHGGSGIPKNQIKEAISYGVVKVNVNTELRLAYHEGLLHEFEVHPDEVVPYKYLPAGTEAVKKVVAAKIRLFGSNNKA